jgi:hypothetical protein
VSKEANMAQAPAVVAPSRVHSNPLVFLGQLIVSPRAALTHLREAGRPSWLWPAGLAIVVLVIAAILTAPITQAAAAAGVEAMRDQMGEDLSPQEQAQFEQGLQLATNPLFTVVVPIVTGVGGLAIGWLVRGGVLFLLGLLFGGHARFSDVFRMAVWTTLPDVVRRVITTAATLISGRVATAGLASLLPAAGPGAVPALGDALWRSFLGGIDVYWLWGLILTTIGMAVTAAFSWRKGLAAAALYWVLTVLAALGSIWLSLSLAASAGFAPS